MEAVYSFETIVNLHHTTQRLIPEVLLNSHDISFLWRIPLLSNCKENGIYTYDEEIWGNRNFEMQFKPYNLINSFIQSVIHSFINGSISLCLAVTSSIS
jgi:hypothetical protein